MINEIQEHFAYDWGDYDGEQLFQGDVLKRTSDLEEVLSELYPYAYQRPETYPFFLVLTQSCDLQKHGERSPKADYITIAAVRPARYLLYRRVAELQNNAEREAGICFSHKKQKIQLFVERLLSNEQEPFFYLHPGKRTPFQEPHVAYLRITFPLRTDSHYDKCVTAKSLQLKPSFQAKLGWLTTLVFGQVGTEDFPPKTRRELASEYIEAIEDVSWVKRRAFLNMARQRDMQGNLSELSEEQVEALLNALEKESYVGMVASAVCEVAENVFGHSDKTMEDFRRALLTDKNFSTLLEE